MPKYLKLFENHTQYETFIGGGGDTPFIRPNVSHCIEENHVHYNPKGWADEYFTIESLEDDNTIYLKTENSAVTKTVSVSTDNGHTWTEYTSSAEDNGTTLATLNSGDKILVKGHNTTYYKTYANSFKTSKQFEVKGNVMSLVYGDSFINYNNLNETSTFRMLFSDCTKLTSAENLVLPATRLTQYCYYEMFSGCTSLTKAPELPTTTLAYGCYAAMFEGCTSLVNAPALPATTLANACYDAMFRDCTSLVNAPELPATSLAELCYSLMFMNCTSLTTAPVLLATTLAIDCYNGMFNGCTSLVTAPELPATTLAEGCYQSMFEHCTNLTITPLILPSTTLERKCYYCMFCDCTSLTTAPELPATSLKVSCYFNMFQGCTNLNYIKCLATNISVFDCTGGWVYNVASSGTFVKAANMESWTTGNSGIPNGWTVQDAS